VRFSGPNDGISDSANFLESGDLSFLAYWANRPALTDEGPDTLRRLLNIFHAMILVGCNHILPYWDPPARAPYKMNSQLTYASTFSVGHVQFGSAHIGVRREELAILKMYGQVVGEYTR
jgi:hypothetical protein